MLKDEVERGWQLPLPEEAALEIPKKKPNINLACCRVPHYEGVDSHD
jgi:hypothetical protein